MKEKRLTDNRFSKDGFYQPKSKEEEKEIRSMGNDLTFEKLYKHCAELEKKNTELQKQVDELKDITSKETAKKIFEELLAYIGINQMFCSIDGRKITLIDCDYLFNYIAKLARHYRIQVNE